MLFIGVILLAAFILFFERGSETSRQQEQRTRTVFATYPESIDRLLLERDGVQIECVRNAGVWRLTQPVNAPVDAGIVAQMIAGLAHVERGEIITAATLRDRGLTPADYGFDKPRARITFKNNRGTFTWLIGRDAPLGNSLYVMPENGSDIVSAPHTLLDLVPLDPAWIRDRILFAGEITTVRGLDLRRPDDLLQLRQTETDGWAMQKPHTGRADKQAVLTLLSQLFSGRIIEFISDEKTDLTTYGLENPLYEITVFTQDEKTHTLLIGIPVPEKPEFNYAKRIESDSIFTVQANWVRELNIQPDRLRSHQILNLPPERTSAITLTHGEQLIELTRTNEQWYVIRPVRWDAANAPVAQLLKTLTDASVLEFIDTPSAEQTAFMKTAPWEIALTADGKSVTLHISEQGEKGLRLVQVNDEPTLFTTDDGIVTDRFADPLFYRSRLMLDVNPSLIEKITTQSGGTNRSVLKTESGSFAAGEADQNVSAQALTDLMWVLNDLRAMRSVDFNPASLTPYGLEQPETALTITLSDTNTIGRIVLVGSKTEDGRYAMIQGQNIVFVVSEETAQMLTRELTVPSEKQAQEPIQP